ncbi:glycoside hydrolase family 140 protein [Pseudozobellia thermophila]|uniref:Putative collagen-binding domain of a collagenase n=1 Tax=Pseudozobellia thermophila TaxID=192903 RepID=A0A1M6G025_9FLAO|nr:glycoside hydrolase family 140 protein [Pseudozobellia thermophila]SHJ03338.1 Putative collagen-binding domain of a collagenase [Pseudozobellia thermophila]
MELSYKRIKLLLSTVVAVCVVWACKTSREETRQPTGQKEEGLPKLKISENNRYFITGKNEPFFWLGDTAWLLFKKLNREEIETYLEDRKQKGFNVIQVMTLHSLDMANVYGDSALVGQNVSKPLVTPGNDPSDQAAYDFWDHVDYTVDLAEKKGLYMALVPVWGTNVKGGGVSQDEAEAYARFLADRYRSKNNIIWLNGGDTHGDQKTEVWHTIGNTLKAGDPDKLMTFHPFGRMQSIDWFNEASWLDFNMFQGGHRRYDQDDSPRGYGQDTWRYIEEGYGLSPIRPTLDGEPSYEGIPQGLHDTLQPLWTADDLRRYGYWSVFAGAAGFTYGHSAVMQMYRTNDKAAYGNKELWYDALHSTGSGQMIHLKNLMLHYPYLERIPDQSLVADQGEKYNYLVATRGKGYALIYTYNGRLLKINMGKISGDAIEARWYDPRTGKSIDIGTVENTGVREFDPPGEPRDGNDWVLVMTSKNG